MLIDLSVVIITFGSLIAAFVNAAFATGGVYILLASGSAVFPMTIAVPLLPLLAFASLVARVFFFWKHVYWHIVLAVFIGSSVGVFLGVNIFIMIPEALLSLIIGCLLIVLIWAGSFKLPVSSSKIFIFVGMVHSLVATVFGVGAFLQPAILRTELVKLQITGTLAACMLSMDIFKIVGFSSLGFNYIQFLPHIIGATLAGFFGTWAGKRATKKISEILFRKVFKWLVTLIALRLVFKGIFGFI